MSRVRLNRMIIYSIKVMSGITSLCCLHVLKVKVFNACIFVIPHLHTLHPCCSSEHKVALLRSKTTCFWLHVLLVGHKYHLFNINNSFEQPEALGGKTLQYKCAYVTLRAFALLSLTEERWWGRC